MHGDEFRTTDNGTFDWNAAFDAIVAGLRPPAYVRVARAIGTALVTAALIGVTWLLLAQVIAAQARGLAYPMR